MADSGIHRAAGPWNGRTRIGPAWDLQEIAAKYRVAPIQAVLRWRLEIGVTVILRSAPPAHRGDLDLFGFSLTPKKPPDQPPVAPGAGRGDFASTSGQELTAVTSATPDPR